MVALFGTQAIIGTAHAEALVSPSGVPVGSTVVYEGDYETGNFSQWLTCQSVFMNDDCADYDLSHYSMQIVGDGQQRQGNYAARYEVRDGDVPNFGGDERSEASTNGLASAEVREGDERWYEFSIKFDENMPNPTGWWFIVMQWHAGKGSPPLAINLGNDGVLNLTADGVRGTPARPIGPIQRGQWVDYVVHAKFSRKASVGFVEVWENGVQKVPKTSQVTMSSKSNYLKQGIYRHDVDAFTSVVLHDGLRVTAP